MEATKTLGPARLGARFDEALTYASEAHRLQCRKGTAVPYVAHCLGVCALVLENGGSEDQAIAALLHDVIEDRGVEYEPDMRRRFGDAVTDMVISCSDSMPRAGQQKAPWRERKAAFLEHLRALSVADPALLVTTCDKLHNLRAMLADVEQLGSAVWDRFNGGYEGQRWYHTQVCEILSTKVENRCTREITRIVAQLFGPPRAIQDR